ncbi:MAG: ThuA domain-containing protein [Planctomycetota bacterium]
MTLFLQPRSFALVAVCLAMTVGNVFGQTAAERLTKLEQASQQTEELWLTFEGQQGPGKGKRVVLIAGDDEYRSEEAMPMLAKILAKRHGFHCTVLFPINPEDNTITPDYQDNIPGMESIGKADVVILGLRFRQLPDDQMKHLVDYLEAGKPVIGLRTSTHAFRYRDGVESSYRSFSFDSRDWKGGFGQQVLGDTWINHHGAHKRESARGVVVKENQTNPILRGVTDVWGPSDVYGIRNLPESATVLLEGQVLDGMTPDSKPVEGKKNDPMMPLAWIKSYQLDGGKQGSAFCTTMGASIDLKSAGLRRLVVNATYWAADLESEIPESANVDYVGEYKPSMFGFGTFAKGLRPKDYDIKK